MPQDQETLEKELRRQMREGRAPLIQAVRDAYEPFLLAKKGWERKNAELREQVGLLSNQFSSKGKLLRESSRKSTDSGAGMVDLYKELSKQAKAVSTLIDKELPNLISSMSLSVNCMPIPASDGRVQCIYGHMGWTPPGERPYWSGARTCIAGD